MVDIMNEDKQIIHNSIRTPDGTILTSASVHDYKVYEDANGHEYMVDGGREYLRRNVVKEAPHEELTLYTDDPHEKIREVFTWGTYGKKGDKPLQIKLLKDLTIAHVKAIIRTQSHMPNYMKQMFINELEYRKDEK